MGLPCISPSALSYAKFPRPFYCFSSSCLSTSTNETLCLILPLGKSNVKDGIVAIASMETQGLMPEEKAELGPEGEVGRTLRQTIASYQLVSKELRSHPKCWVDQTDKQVNWTGTKPKEVTSSHPRMEHEQVITVIN